MKESKDKNGSRVIALGGAGDMGRRAVLDLAEKEEVSKLIIADYNLEEAEKLAASIGKEKVTALRVDANDHDGMVRAIEGNDVATGTIGPFYMYEKKVAKAAIDAGVNYVSICDDYDGARDVMSLDSSAKKNGVTIITGLGWTPGISNMLAKKGADEMDSVEKIAISWAGSEFDSEGYAVDLHTFHLFTGKVPSYQGGKWIDVNGGDDRELVAFPKPIGKIHVYNAGHPEPVTIPRYIPEVKTVTLKGGLREPFTNWLDRFITKIGLTRTHAQKEFMGHLYKDILSNITKGAGRPKEEEIASGTRVEVMGMKDGEKSQIIYTNADHMNNLTGLPLAIGALMLGKGEIQTKGVLAPEGCIDPDEFLFELGKRGVRIFEGEEMEKQIN